MSRLILFLLKQPVLLHTLGWKLPKPPFLSRSVVFNVDEIVPRERFHALWGRFCDLRDLEGDCRAIAVSKGRFLQVKTYSKVELIPKKQYLLLWNQSIWCTFNSMVRNKGYKTHIGLATHQSNYCNMVLWNASLHQLPKTTEIVTGWESSIAVLMKIIGNRSFDLNLMLTLKFTNFDLFWHINFLCLKLQKTQKQIHSIHFKFLKNLVT